ncbi:DMT family transporter [Pelagibaculum spongiae]|uniref:EamA family transporter n=1 Tax=Pelagibaculum spongiae TaxID=2080658 RepID=A0A2V1H3N4_9GAMM|nr:DMT family transporter [Pelagibaculum spongiae]PVZ71797.1 EamA family transporter [Pelagibaculum spongiae]
MNNESKGMMYGVLAVSAFSLTLPATRHIIEFFNPVFLGLGRAVVAALIAGGILIFTGQSWPSKQQLVQLILIALGVVIGFPVLSAVAMQYVAASHGGVVLGLLPLTTTLFAVLITAERPSTGFWLMAILGSLLVVAFSLIKGGGSLHLADFALLGSIIFAGVGYAVGGKLSRQLGGWQVICWALVIALPFIVIPSGYYFPENPELIPLEAWLSFLYLALVSQLFGLFLWNKGLAIGGISRVSQTQLLQPFITLIASAIMLSEVLELQTILFAMATGLVVFFGKKSAIRASVK